ncbi:MAG: hypothetical protein HW410_26 [Nitrosarchaeum sp.]|nr:hypothetical protein [Nitrosarchaeum sp.]
MNKKYSVFLGDNPFFGVNHLSQEIARNKSKNSQNFNNILAVINTALDNGVKDVVFSTHPELKNLITFLKNNSNIMERINIHPILPYAQGYVSKVNENGMMNTLKDVLGSVGFRKKIQILAKGGLGVVKNDFYDLFRVLIDIEMTKLENSKIKTVFLHDVVTDLALGLGVKKILQVFKEHIEKNYKLEVGVVTKNFPLLVSKMEEWNVNFPTVMTSFNKIGFQMNPSRESCERSLEKYDGKVIAMSVMAGGYIGLEESMKYLSSLPKISTLVIGTSSVENAKKTFSTIQNLPQQ